MFEVLANNYNVKCKRHLDQLIKYTGVPVVENQTDDELNDNHITSGSMIPASPASTSLPLLSPHRRRSPSASPSPAPAPAPALPLPPAHRENNGDIDIVQNENETADGREDMCEIAQEIVIPDTEREQCASSEREEIQCAENIELETERPATSHEKGDKDKMHPEGSSLRSRQLRPRNKKINYKQ